MRGEASGAAAWEWCQSHRSASVETCTHSGVGRRVSRRQTTVDSRTINIDLTWTDLGTLASVTYPDDTGLSDPARTVSPTYSWGYQVRHS